MNERKKGIEEKHCARSITQCTCLGIHEALGSVHSNTHACTHAHTQTYIHKKFTDKEKANNLAINLRVRVSPVTLLYTMFPSLCITDSLT